MPTDHEVMLHEVGRERPALKIRRKKPRKRNRGCPPPLPFDLNALPDSALLTERETGAVIRRSLSTLESWRRFQPNHPLRWRRVGGRILYEVKAVRTFLRGDNGK